MTLGDFIGIASLEMVLYTYLTLNVLDTFAEILAIGNHHVDLVLVVVGVIVVSPGPELGLSVAVCEAGPSLESIKSPY